MNTYARIDDGRVVEIVLPMTYDDGSEILISDRFTAEYVATLVDITNVTPTPVEGMAYDGASFSDYLEPAPTRAELLVSNGAIKDSLLSSAYVYIAPLQLSISLGDATDTETAEAKQWQAYVRSLKAIDLGVENVVWPATPADA